MARIQVVSHIDFSRLFTVHTSIPELIIRGSVMYLALFALLRIVLKRQTGTVNIGDLLLVVLIADAAQNGLSGDYHSITEGIVLVAVLIFWNYVIDFLSFVSPRFHRFVFPPRLLLVKDGKIIPQHLRKEFITNDELLAHLHQEGMESVCEVKEAYMEGNGQITFVPIKK